MMNTRSELLVLLAFVLGMGSCRQDGDHSKPLDRDRFVRVYAELLESAQKVGTSPPDSVRTPEMTQILKRNEITEEQFRSSVDSYRLNVAQWKGFYDEVLKVLEENRLARGDTLTSHSAPQ
jgi:hypothetical protein